MLFQCLFKIFNIFSTGFLRCYEKLLSEKLESHLLATMVILMVKSKPSEILTNTTNKTKAKHENKGFKKKYLIVLS